MSSRGRSPSTDRSSQSPAPTAKPLSERTKGNELCLFFSDNTLSEGRGRVTPDMIMHLDTLRETCAIGVVSASDIETLSRQFGGDGNDGGKEVLGKFDYVFADNGVTAYKDGKTLPESTSFRKYVGQPNYNKLVNKILELVMNIPIDKTGTFLELRGDMMHITPVGRSADQDERKAFQRQDNRRKIRGKLIAELREFIKKDDELNTKRLTVTMSGLISVNIVPEDWNKAHCLKTLEKGTWKTVHIIGDKTRPGGDGTAISTTLNVEEYTVTDPDDTMDLLGEAFGVSF